MSALERIEDALREHGCRGGRGHWTCPAHQDRAPSLSVREGADGRALVHCFAGCATADVLAALGLAMRDLFDGQQPSGWRPAPTRPQLKPRRARMGLPTCDDLFWSQDEAAIDAHFARLAALPAPTDDEIRTLVEGGHRV